jgi:hypothetical protein
LLVSVKQDNRVFFSLLCMRQGCIVHLYCMLLFPGRRLHATKTTHQEHINSLRAVWFTSPNPTWLEIKISQARPILSCAIHKHLVWLMYKLNLHRVELCLVAWHAMMQ